MITIKMTLSILLKLLHSVHFEDAGTLELLQNLQVYLIPVVNPDGIAYIEADDDIIDGLITLKRKNGRVSGLCPLDEEGVDINRNYDIGWGGPPSNDRVVDPCDETYRG